MPVNRNNISKKFQSEVFKRFTRRNGGKLVPNATNRVRYTGRSDIPKPAKTSSPIKYGSTRPMPTVQKHKDQEPNRPRPRRRRKDFPRSTKPSNPQPHHKKIENNKPQPHQNTHPNKTPNPVPRPVPTPTPTPIPPKSKYDLTNLPDKTNLRDKPPIKYPQPTPNPTPTPQTYPVGSKYGPNRPMPNIKSPASRTSKYDFTRKDVSPTPKNFDNETLVRKLNRRRNGS